MRPPHRIGLAYPAPPYRRIGLRKGCAINSRDVSKLLKIRRKLPRGTYVACKQHKAVAGFAHPLRILHTL